MLSRRCQSDEDWHQVSCHSFPCQSSFCRRRGCGRLPRSARVLFRSPSRSIIHCDRARRRASERAREAAGGEREAAGRREQGAGRERAERSWGSAGERGAGEAGEEAVQRPAAQRAAPRWPLPSLGGQGPGEHCPRGRRTAGPEAPERRAGSCAGTESRESALARALCGGPVGARRTSGEAGSRFAFSRLRAPFGPALPAPPTWGSFERLEAGAASDSGRATEVRATA